jgi:hypothetical protein
MTDLDIAGLGVWSPFFADWPAFCEGSRNGKWQTEVQLRPGLIPPRELRRSPQSVKMAVEVMSQACAMAKLDPADMAVVFSSSMGDIQITDYLCRTLAATPGLVSPTRFHNSVHNATTGYWSIASQAQAPTNAVSAYAYTAPMALFEAAVQVAEEELPVLLVCQEMAAPEALHFACPSNHPFSMALLLTRPGLHANPLASLQIGMRPEAVDWPALRGETGVLFEGNFGARLLPLLNAMAAAAGESRQKPATFDFPLSKGSSLTVSLNMSKPVRVSHG